ncbi:MAG: nitroreductase family protein [Candidatus Hodarchaeota archaeon]
MKEKEIQTILARRSIRQYTDEPVSEDDIMALLQAAMAAPSGSNLKPWHFVTITERTKLNALAEVKTAANMLKKASLCITVCGDENASESYWVQDCSAATENILIAASALGLGAVWIGIYPLENRVNPVKEILELPDAIIPLCLIAIGHPAEEKEPRTQYDASRVHREQW